MSSTSELPPPTLVDVIRSDQYWPATQVIHTTDTRFPPTNAYSGNGRRHFRQAMKLAESANIEPLGCNEPLPKISLPVGMLKLVIDQLRMEWIKNSRLGKTVHDLASYTYFPGVKTKDKSIFDYMARSMVEDPLYTGPGVVFKRDYVVADDIVTEDISRRVVYASNVGSPSSKLLTYDWLVGYGSQSLGQRSIGKQILDIVFADEECYFGVVSDILVSEPPKQNTFNTVEKREKLVSASIIRF